MNCVKCGVGFGDGVAAFYPIDPKGTKNRRWVCDKCADNETLDSIPEETKEIVSLINPDARTERDA